MGVTVKDVARAAGVSTATVSRSLRGFDTVDPTIREHVLLTAERLGYVGSHAAAALSTGRAGTIAIITPFVDRLAFQRMLAGVENVAQRTGVALLLYCTGDPSDPHPRPPYRTLAQRVDGFIVLSLSAESPDVADLLKLGMPVSMFGARLLGASSVQIDDRGGAASAVRHLIDLGHRRIGVIYGKDASDPAVLEHERHLGVRDAFEAAHLPSPTDLIVPGRYTMADGATAMNVLLDREEPPTAVFAFSDEMAYGAIQAMRRRGLRPGHDIALIGYDGHEMSSVLELSTISVPFEEIGARAATLLLDEIGGVAQQSGHIDDELQTKLIVRASTAPDEEAFSGPGGRS
jgi:LacI family repressor for deo operon, udp, cdd, tsx, nupC, and nupG